MRAFLIFAAGMMSALVHASGIDQFKSFLETTRQARGVFSQSVLGKSGRKPQQSSGSFAFSRPGKFRWTYDKPFQQLLVSNGEKLWSYDPELRQVTVGKLGKALGASPAALLAGDALEDNFVIADGGAADGHEFVEATPKARDGSFERVRIGFRERLPRIMEIRDNFGQTTTLLLDRFEVNPVLPADLFRFVPPMGVDVIGD